MLFEVFSQVGPVASIRVCRDVITRRSLGYAYVNFQSQSDAERAMEALNFTPIKGKPCRIMWKHRDPSLRKSGANNIFIKNLDKSIDIRALYDTFSAFGTITSCKVAMDEGNHSKGYGFVQYAKEEQAQTAIQKVNGMLINSNKVFVAPFIPRQEREKMTSDDFTNVYLKNLPEDVDDEKLEEMCKGEGKVLSAAVMKDAEGKSKGFGFVSFEDHGHAKGCVERLNGTGEGEKKIYAGPAEKKSRRHAELRAKFDQKRIEQQQKFAGVNLYVKHLDDDCDDEKLRQAFAQFGTITSCKVMKDDKAQTRGFGFVCFSSPEEATRAVTGMNGQMFGSKPLYVALHQTRDVRRAQLQAQHAALMQGRGPMMGAMPAGMPPAQPIMFAPPGGAPGQRQVMMYPPAMMPPGRWVQQQPMGHMQGSGRQQYGRQQRQRGQQPHAVNAGQQAKFRYTTNVRNRSDQAPQATAAQQPMAQQMDQKPAAQINPMQPLDAGTLAQASPDQQKQILGERLFAQIQGTQPQLAGKITGMLLELDNGELLHLLQSPEALAAKVEEAIAALNAHTAASEEA